MVLGSDSCLTNNFNNFIFANDLIITFKASTVVAKGCKFYSNIYYDLISQTPNLLKSTAHLPTWCNKRIANFIHKILNMSLAQFPFKYLSVLICLRSLKTDHF